MILLSYGIRSISIVTPVFKNVSLNFLFIVLLIVLLTVFNVLIFDSSSVGGAPARVFTIVLLAVFAEDGILFILPILFATRILLIANNVVL